MNYERHYFSSCWPDITGEDYEHLKDSIHLSGLRDAITLYEGQILDGWNRYRACNDMEMPAHYVEFEGTPDEAEQFVQDKHNRRSLTLTQRLTCIGLMRQRPKVGRPNNTAGPAVLTAKDMAKKAGSGLRYAEHVSQAISKGAPELVASMKAGKVGAEKAAAISKLPQSEQAAAIDKPLPKQFKPVEEEGAPDQDEFDSVAAAEKAEVMAMKLLLASDEPLADITAKYEQALLQVERLNARIIGLQNQSTHQIKTIKALQNKLKKLEQAA